MILIEDKNICLGFSSSVDNPKLFYLFLKP